MSFISGPGPLSLSLGSLQLYPASVSIHLLKKFNGGKDESAVFAQIVADWAQLSFKGKAQNEASQVLT